VTEITPDLIAELCHRRGWRQWELADTLRVDERTIQKWQNGERLPNEKNRAAILRLLAETET
jgi:ribosome-binding protein aMBF1 (putative translation factor)